MAESISVATRGESFFAVKTLTYGCLVETTHWKCYTMANKTVHVTVGVILALIYIPIDFYVINNDISYTWLYWLAAVLLAIVGSEGPDLDHLYSFMSHRDIVTHSAIYPGIIFGLCVWWRLSYAEPILSVFIPFFIAYSSHLFLDYFPNVDLRKLSDGEIRIKEKRGTFLMHVPFIYRTKEGKERRTLDVKNTERWLLTNAFLVFCMGAFLIIMQTLDYFAIS
jgi:hypothetical protein